MTTATPQRFGIDLLDKFSRLGVHIQSCNFTKSNQRLLIYFLQNVYSCSLGRQYIRTGPVYVTFQSNVPLGFPSSSLYPLSADVNFG